LYLFIPSDKADVFLDHTFLGVLGTDELDPNFAAVLEQEADLTG
jgi:hypothetical protein